MKPTVLIPIFAAVAGFSAGWLLKPAPDSPDSPVAETQDKGRTGGKSHDRRGTPLVLKPRGGASGNPEDSASSPETVAAIINHRKSFQGALELAENARLSRFAEALGLSPDQKEAISALLAGRRDGFRELAGQRKAPADLVADAANAERIFRQEVEKVLDAEQVAALDAKIQREKENAVQASAYDDLADLSRQIDLSPEQREQALATLLETSQAAHDRRPEGWAVMSESFSVLGDQQLGALDDIADILHDPEALKNPQALHQFQMEARRKDMERKIAQLSGILTPAQLAQYRSTLNSRLTLIEQAPPPPSFQKR